MSKVVDYIWSKRENALLFAASLFISLLIFMQLQSSALSDAERDMELPLEFINVGDDIIVFQAARKVKVRATGPQQVIDSLDTSKITAFVDLKGAEPGGKRFQVKVIGPTRENLVLSALQGNVQIVIERKVTKNYPVTVEPFGVPPESFRYEGAVPYPSTVQVSGPESIMDDVRSVRAVLDLTRIRPRETFDIGLEVLGEGNRPVPVVVTDPLTVAVTPAISISATVRRLLVNVVTVNRPATGYRFYDITVTPDYIEATGRSADLSLYTTVNTEPIDLSGLRESKDFEVEVILPDRLTATGRTTVTVHVEVRRN